MLDGGAEMVVKEGKKNEKETASLRRSGKRKKTEKGGKEKRKRGKIGHSMKGGNGSTHFFYKHIFYQ